MGLRRQRNYAGRWDVLIQQATQCLNRLIQIAARKKRNYILDQVLNPSCVCVLMHVLRFWLRTQAEINHKRTRKAFWGVVKEGQVRLVSVLEVGVLIQPTKRVDQNLEWKETESGEGVYLKPSRCFRFSPRGTTSRMAGLDPALVWWTHTHTPSPVGNLLCLSPRTGNGSKRICQNIKLSPMRMLDPRLHCS